MAAPALGLLAVGLGALWLISRARGPLDLAYRGAKATVEAPGEFAGGLFGEWRKEEDVPYIGFEDVPRIDPASGASTVFGTPRTWEPDIPTNYRIIDGKVEVENPSPAIPGPAFYTFDDPSLVRRAGTAARENIREAITIDEYTGDPFQGTVPFTDKEFDILGWFR